MDVDELLQKIKLGSSQSEEVNDEKYEDYGYQHLSIIRNLGFHIIILAFFAVLVIVWYILQSIKGSNIR